MYLGHFDHFYKSIIPFKRFFNFYKTLSNFLLHARTALTSWMTSVCW